MTIDLIIMIKYRAHWTVLIKLQTVRFYNVNLFKIPQSDVFQQNVTCICIWYKLNYDSF